MLCGPDVTVAGHLAHRGIADRPGQGRTIGDHVVDDAFQQVTHIVRGEDLLFSTARQIRLQQALGYVTPGYAHHPLVRDGSGHKLGKSTSAWPVDAARPLATLKSVLEFLHQPPVDADTIDSFWKQAIANWTIEAMQHA